MRRSICLLFGYIFIAMLLTLPVKAQNFPCENNGQRTGCPTNVSNIHAPINGGIIYLLIAGIAIGIIAVKKQKNALVKA